MSIKLVNTVEFRMHKGKLQMRGWLRPTFKNIHKSYNNDLKNAVNSYKNIGFKVKR